MYDKLNTLQLIALEELGKRLTDENIEALLEYMDLVRNEHGATQPKDNSDRVSVKVYLHKEHRQLMNDYCTITGQSVSSMIRRVTLQHIKEAVENYGLSSPKATAISSRDTP